MPWILDLQQKIDMTILFNNSIELLKHRGPCIKTKLPLQVCMNCLTIMIGQLVFFNLTYRQLKRKGVNKIINRQLLIFY